MNSQSNPGPTLSVEELGLIDVFHLMWRAKITVILISLLFGAAGLTYAVLTPDSYRTQTVLVQTSNNGVGGALAQFGGLASIAGISIPAQGASQEPIAVLRSRDLLREFIEARNLVPVLFASRWDEASGKWRTGDSRPPPDISDAVSLFDRRIRAVVDDKKNGLVILQIAWTDPKLAQTWAEELVVLANHRMRIRALEEAGRNIEYLSAALAETSVAAVQQAIGRTLESELQKELLARGNEEFAFRIVDRPEMPKLPVGPRRTMLVVMSLVLGFFMAAVVVLLRDAVVPRWRALRAV